MQNLKFILVDNNAEFRQGLRDLLEIEYSATVTDEAANGNEFLQLNTLVFADIIIMDLFMPELNGFETTKRFIQKYPVAKVIAVTSHIEKIYIQQLIESGFKGCIFKDEIFHKITEAVNVVMEGNLYFPFFSNPTNQNISKT